LPGWHENRLPARRIKYGQRGVIERCKKLREAAGKGQDREK